ncbi:MAG: copper resistance D family protein [Candidimonas sp.]|nr:MAG: copper resistance D family protein [Candidimonas sp.]TAM22134.1 MAG: copper resistance D family protein [Candidimonas sp.]TAM79422.1 MAG: copper resistance D family protein [Candidimonas sp.]
MSVEVVYVWARLIHFSAIYLLFGLSIYVECLTPVSFRGESRARTRLWLLFSCLVAGLGALALLLLEAGQMGNGWPDVWNPATWLKVLDTTFGRVWRWQLVLSGVAVYVALFGPLRYKHTALLLLSPLILLCMAFVGHAAMHDGALGAFARFNQAVHLYSSAYWLGCLVPLWLTLAYLKTDRRSEVIRTHVNFSTLGHIAVAGVIASGMVNIDLVLGKWPFHWASPYQRLLLLKIILVGLMLLLALMNRYVLVPAINRNSERANKIFGRAVALEIVFGVGVLALVSVFATLAPV